MKVLISGMESSMIEKRISREKQKGGGEEKRV